MTKISRIVLSMVGAAALCAAAAPSVEIEGNYVEARSADVNAGDCFINSEVQLVGNLAVFGWEINHGTWKGVKLDGLSLWGLMQGEAGAWPDRTLYLQWHRGDAPEPFRNAAAVKQRYKLVNGSELYDLEADPNEFENLWSLESAAPLKMDLLKKCFDSTILANMDPKPRIIRYF